MWFGTKSSKMPRCSRARRCDETLPGGLAAEIRANATRIGHVVAMHAARVCLQARGEVYVTHAELGEVGKNPLRILQREARMQLQAVSPDPFIAHGLARRTSAR